MIIPIKCFTCGNVLADKYRYYQQKVLELKIEEEGGLEETDMENVNKVKYLYLPQHYLAERGKTMILHFAHKILEKTPKTDFLRLIHYSDPFNNLNLKN